MNSTQTPSNNATDSGTRTEDCDIFWSCGFASCKRRPWFEGFKSLADIAVHKEFHRCQWLVLKGENLYLNCDYIPTGEEDLKEHIKNHMVTDMLPKIVGEDGAARMFCPWQSCTSWSFAVKGTCTKGHINEHILTHAAELKSRLGKISRNMARLGEDLESAQQRSAAAAAAMEAKQQHLLQQQQQRFMPPHYAYQSSSRPYDYPRNIFHQ